MTSFASGDVAVAENKFHIELIKLMQESNSLVNMYCVKFHTNIGVSLEY